MHVEFPGDSRHGYRRPLAYQSALSKSWRRYDIAIFLNLNKSILKHIDEVLQAEENITLAVLRDSAYNIIVHAYNLSLKLVLLEVILAPSFARFEIFNSVFRVQNCSHIFHFIRVSCLVILRARYDHLMDLLYSQNRQVYDIDLNVH